MSLPCYRPSILMWIILAFAALNVIFLGGKRRAFGSFVAEFTKVFPNIKLTELNWIGDSYSAFGYMSTSLTISIIIFFNRRFEIFQFLRALWILISCITSSFVPNPHWLFLTHTLFHGIGSSLIISTAGLVVNEYFDKKHKYHLLATTLVSGGSVASILFVTLFSWLIEKYGWESSFRILGVIYFIICGSAAIFYRKNPDISEVNNKGKLTFSCKGYITAMHVPLLIFWFVDRVLTSVVTYGLLLNLTHFIYKDHKSLVNSSKITMLFAAGEAVTYLIGAIITAITKDFFKEKLRYILLITSYLMCCSLALLHFFDHIGGFSYFLFFAAGFNLGPSITFLFPAGEELTRLPGHMAYPFSLGGMGFGMMISPLLTAKIIEISSFKWFFLVQGGLIFIKTCCLFMIILLLKCLQTKLDILAKSISISKSKSINKLLDDENTSILEKSLNTSYGLH